ncbi:Xaa-Pro aminopeptidase 1 [Blattella germanica]|nr:Xaa-Pro aminopeptidase 1 [Blattella germanica]
MSHTNGDSSSKLQKLRGLMKNVKYVSEPLQAYIIPSEDAHQSEYLAECDRRRAFISGFTGSAGTAIVTENEACLWTDGRYFLQATQEMDNNWTLMREGIPTTLTQGAWLVKNLPSGSRIGTDPNLIPYHTWTTLQTELTSGNHTLVPINTNLIDLIWEDKPSAPCNPVMPLSVKYTGKTSSVKVKEIHAQMIEKGVMMLVVSALDEVASELGGKVWVSSDASYALAALVPEKRRVGEITPIPVMKAIKNPISAELGGKVWVSSDASYALAALVPEKRRVGEITPIPVMKAIKNPVEIEGLIRAHVRDAVAVCCYFAWLEKEIVKSTVTEISGSEKLEQFRSEQEDFIGPSFSTISSAGPHAAIIHYEPSKKTDRQITTEEIYLCDSGGQYKDGTTDITRTLHFGTPTQHEKESFTRVFKGQCFMGTTVFPSKTKGNCLDTLARKFLWDVGLDYMHGTGHGIGMYLNVHEGPMGISWRVYPNDPGLQEGMFLSNEPGYYEDGKFGIRIEDIVRIVKANTPFNFKDRGYLTFETVTLVPIQTKMLVPEMLTDKEIRHLNEYHSRCRETVGPLLKKMGHHEAYEWLCRETEPIG